MTDEMPASSEHTDGQSDGTTPDAASNSDEDAASGGVRSRVSAWTVLNVAAILLLIAVVVPFAIYAVPQAVGGSQSYVVLSGSMEPAMSPGDAIIVEDVEAGQIRDGDVITFTRESETRPTTHRVESVIEQGDERLFVTKGDANEDADQQEVSASQIEGRVMTVGGYLFVIPYIGYVLEFAQTQAGFVLLFVLPIALFLLNEAYNLVTNGTKSEPATDSAESDPTPAEEVLEDLGDATAVTAAQATAGEESITVIDDAEDVATLDAGTVAGSETAADVETKSGTGEEATTYSLRPAEFRIGVLVLVLFAGYSVWVAYAMVEPWSIGTATAVVVATLLFGGLYLFGGPSDSSGNETPAMEGVARQVVVQQGDPPSSAMDLDAQSIPSRRTLLELARATTGVLYHQPEEDTLAVVGADVRYVLRDDETGPGAGEGADDETGPGAGEGADDEWLLDADDAAVAFDLGRIVTDGSDDDEWTTATTQLEEPVREMDADDPAGEAVASTPDHDGSVAAVPPHEERLPSWVDVDRGHPEQTAATNPSLASTDSSPDELAPARGTNESSESKEPPVDGSDDAEPRAGRGPDDPGLDQRSGGESDD